ncbi:UNKNOWN [Stylonychia lemnae]|uniref:Uncharacterized protein n=1 Tax=Stylonychia lemnae TaxID=5949 RepID=A0A078B2E2_STYLE|nr:UNKNOWN [Stylonychia lemnae]|eukprot:CDW87648.1 UNKNOWN [Stylonychia lemnae]
MPVPSFLLDSQFRRIFSKSQPYKQIAKNFGDGITVPSTFLNLMDKDQKAFAMYENQIVCHISKIDEGQDNDILEIPDWMYYQLRIREGEPLALNIDLTFYSYEIEEPHSIFFELLDQDSLHIHKDKLIEIVRGEMGKYKILRNDNILSFLMPDGYPIQVLTVQIEPKGSNYYINNQPHKLIIDIVNYDGISKKNILQAKQTTEQEKEQFRLTDLNEIIRTKGFTDLDLLEKAINRKQMKVQTLQQKFYLSKDSKQKRHKTQLHHKSLVPEQAGGDHVQYVSRDSQLVRNTTDQIINTENVNYSQMGGITSMSSRTVKNAQNLPSKFNTVIKKKDEILNLRSMSIEFKRRIQTHSKIKSTLQQQQQIKEIMNDSKVQDYNISQRNNTEGAMQMSSTEKEVTLAHTDSFCNSYYGQILNRKMQDNNTLRIKKQEQDDINMNKRKSQPRPLTQPLQRDTHFRIHRIETRREKAEKMQKQQNDQLQIKIQINQVHARKGKLPLSTPGVLKMMFNKYNKMIHQAHGSNKNSQILIPRNANIERSSSQNRPRTGSTIIKQIKIATQKPLLEKERHHKLDLRISIPSKLNDKQLICMGSDSDTLSKSAINPWPQMTHLTEKSHFLTSLSKEKKHPTKVLYKKHDQKKPRKSDPAQKTISDKKQYIKEEIQNDNDREDLDQIMIENSAFKYMFSDRISNESPDVKLSHDNQSFLKDHDQIRFKVKDFEMFPDQQQQEQKWQIAKISEIKANILNKKREKSMDYSQRIHQINPKNIVSPQYMLYKRKKNLKTLVIEQPRDERTLILKQKTKTRKQATGISDYEQNYYDSSQFIMNLYPNRSIRQDNVQITQDNQDSINVVNFNPVANVHDSAEGFSSSLEQSMIKIHSIHNKYQ